MPGLIKGTAKVLSAIVKAIDEGISPEALFEEEHLSQVVAQARAQ